MIDSIFAEFNSVLKPGGYLLATVKTGSEEGFQDELIGIKIEIYNSLFIEEEIKEYFVNGGFELVFIKNEIHTIPKLRMKEYMPSGKNNEVFKA